LESPNPFSVELGQDLEINLGDQAVLSPYYSISPDSVSWFADGLIDCAVNCESVTYYPSVSGMVSMEANSAQGCLSSDTIQVSVNEARKVFIPNAFSPNGDGYNDHFLLFGDVPNVQGVEEFIVFDRWGAVVFYKKNGQINDPDSGWDGYLNGKLSQPGVYVYMARIRFLDDVVKTYTGDLTLNR
ncbi:MAG: gliding motility-associated C-terminal domain-containing protein, partial [Saprospiraceae bacterium]|nr:gliding motility-associated C-terminal domain-containing protein [Saprospiraceae bacterium]